MLLDFEENRPFCARENFGTAHPEVELATLCTLTVRLNHRAEAALRAWGLNDDIVRAGMGRINERRYKTVFNVIQAIVGDNTRSRLLTDLGMAMLLGYEQMVTTGNVTPPDDLFDEFVQLVLSNNVRGSRRR